ncbi:uncharacterized protein LOC128673667 isoform X2 [Plodia interpunctella]|uniref:uncharacterized protein LOC128673667 isoform X2 n=1 Tax=Plodia interpunctella TaxID=58824 RepID=UPI0023683164|nr:uncharacterized protein LOC128673667 isoform X2 [Plodia interpunctella]
MGVALMCVACLVTKRVSADDEARLALLLQKLSREWSLLNSITWDNVGGAFADAVYGGYVIITFGLILARIFQEIPRGRRILEGFFLGFGMLFFLILGGLELASLDSVPYKLVTNASVLGSFSLIVAALFLVDLMGPRIYTSVQHSQTDPFSSPKADKKVSIATLPIQSQQIQTVSNGQLSNAKKNGHVPERPKDLDLEKSDEKMTKKDNSSLFDSPQGYTKFEDEIEKDELETSKFGSLRNGLEGGNYVHLSDPLFEYDRFHYEQELAKFNEKYLKNYLDMVDRGLPVREDYLPEPQTPVFAKVKSGRLKSLYDDVSPTYEQKRQSRSPSRAKTVTTPTLQQLEDYLRSSNRSKRGDTPALFPMEPIVEKEAPEVEGRASGTPTDPGYVQYTAGKWPDKREVRTPRHSPK